jgi:glyceraldehyde-3-phosphate dehydrogenase/erythrose-4-phosphate dehydrogenase
VIDATYFKSGLLEQLKSAGDKSTVEVHLINAHTHRVRSVLDATPAYVTLEAHRQRIDGGRSDQHWQAKPSADEASAEMVRVVVAYECIAEIVITPAEDSAIPRIGFVRG